MKRTLLRSASLALMAGALALTGCADEESSSDDGSVGIGKGTVNARMDTFYPTKIHQAMDSGVLAAVPTTTPVVIRFDKSVYDLPTFDDITFELVDDSSWENIPVDFDIEYANNGRTLILVPKEELEPFSQYYVNVVVEPGDDSWDPIYRVSKFFETRGGDAAGPVEESSSRTDELVGDRVFPSLPNYGQAKNSRAPIYPFSPYVMAFSQPIDESTVSYGDGEEDTVKLIIPDDYEYWPPPPVGQGEFVDAEVVVAGNYIILEPKEPLDIDADYRFVMKDDETDTPVLSIYGNPIRRNWNGIGSFSFNFGADRVETTEGDWPKTVNLQFAGGKSPVTDAPYNSVPPGRGGSAGGIPIGGGLDVKMQIDYIPRDAGTYEARSPFVIDKETVGEAPLQALQNILAGNMEARVFQEGMHVEFLSDPVGMITWRTHFNWAEAGTKDTVEMYAILGLVDAQGNVQHKAFIELLGEATGWVEDGDMTLDLFGATDPEVLGQERLPGNGLVHLKLNMTGEVED